MVDETRLGRILHKKQAGISIFCEIVASARVSITLVCLSERTVQEQRSVVIKRSSLLATVKAVRSCRATCKKEIIENNCTFDLFCNCVASCTDLSAFVFVIVFLQRVKFEFYYLGFGRISEKVKGINTGFYFSTWFFWKVHLFW